MAISVPQQPRGPGRITSGSFTVPQLGKKTAVLLTAVMDPADLADSSLVIPYGVEWSQDGGATWADLATSTWSGGAKDGAGPFPPGLVVSMHDGTKSLLVGSEVRLFAVLPRVVRLGVNLTAV